MYVTICGRFCLNEGGVVGYVNWMKAKYTANWGVQIVGMIFQTRSKTIIICHYDNGLNVNPTSFHFPDILYSPVLSPKSLQLVSRASNEQNSGFYMKFFLHFFSSPQFWIYSTAIALFWYFTQVWATGFNRARITEIRKILKKSIVIDSLFSNTYE